MSSLASVRNPLLGKLNAAVVLAAWACLLSAFAWLAYAKATAADGSALPFIVLFGLFAALALVHFVLARWIRCPHCNEKITAQDFSRAAWSDWSGLVVKWFSGSVVCIHCGKRVSTRGAMSSREGPQ